MPGCREQYKRPDGSIDYSHPDVPDTLLDIQQATAAELGVKVVERQEYAAVPAQCWHLMRPPERLFLALHFAYRTWNASEPDGWYRLSFGLYTRAGLENRETRRRAVDTLARRGVIDVRRDGTRTTLVRLTNPGPKKITNRRVRSSS